jgi:SAM-dependent methyltransferase
MSPRAVELPFPDSTVHPVGVCHTGRAGEIQQRLLEFYGMRPDSDLLEIGCGIGRLAYALGPWLDAGTYTGFDIAPAAIAWLNENYGPLLPNFTFDLVEVTNARYRPKDGDSAAKVGFPYPDDAFDFACSFSVFTHMRLDDIRNYLRELARVLRPGGKGVMTCYMLTEADRDVELKSFGPFVPVGDGAWSAAPELPERAIGYQHDEFVEEIAKAGLTVVVDAEGRWHGRKPDVAGPGYDQDFFVLSPA